MIPHIPLEELLFLEDPQMDFFHLRELIRNSNNDEADSNELRNLKGQQKNIVSRT